MKTERRASELLKRFLTAWGGTRKLDASQGHGHESDELKVYLQVGSNVQRLHVGTLKKEGGEFVFRYSLDFKDQYDVPPIPAFPHVAQEYRSETLWPFFSVRLPPVNRDDVKRVIAHSQIDTDDELRMLAILGRRMATTPYELELCNQEKRSSWSGPPAEAY